MTIHSEDIAWRLPANITPTDDHGGPRSQNPLVDRQLNQLLGPIADLDRVGGALSGGKVFVGPDVPTNETWYKPILYLTSPPADPDVEVGLIAAKEFDTWADGKAALSRYRTKAALSPSWLLLDHYSPSAVVTIYQRPDNEEWIPELGETLLLIAHEGTPSEISEGIVVSDVQSAIQKFSINGQDVSKRVITLSLKQGLQHDFPGNQVDKDDTVARATNIYTTRVVNAIGLRGIKPLVQDGEVGNPAIRIETPFAQLVPASKSTSLAANVRVMGDATQVLAETPRRVEVGTATFALRQLVKDQTRTDRFIFTLRPLPALGTVRVLFRASGAWYTLADNGSGALTGEGGGTANAGTGIVTASLNALPDVGTMVICLWGPNLVFSAGTVGEVLLPAIFIDLAQPVASYAGCAISWPSAGVIKTATANAAGILSGDAVGYFVSRQRLKIQPTAMIDAGGEWQVSYPAGTAADTEELINVTETAGQVAADLAHPVEPGTLSVEWQTSVTTTVSAGVSTGPDRLGPDFPSPVEGSARYYPRDMGAA